MNEQQYTKLAKRLIKSPEQREAVCAAIFTDMSCHAAEIQYNRPMATVKRDVNRINELFEFFQELSVLGELDDCSNSKKE